MAGNTLPGETGVPPGGCPIADNCPLVINQDQADADGDGAGNACDRCPTVADTGIDGDGDGVDDACDPDDDGDGVADASDNCPSVKNADQRDINRNGIGTACDPQEQIAVTLGQSDFDLPIRQRLEQNQVIELNLVPNFEEPGLCGLAGSGLTIQISITAGLSFVAGVVDDTGRFAGHVEGESEGAMEFVPAADLCAPQVPRSGESVSLKSAFRGRSYALQILLRNSPPDGSTLRVKVEVIERAAGPPPRSRY
jgi:hypothetical protein